jgi:large subunit ribosomal protein L4
MCGYDETMQLYKWEWPGSNKKMRQQRMPRKLGKARMGRRVSHGWYEGVFARPVRPRDWRARMQRRLIWHALRVMLSAKFAQNQIKIVDSFNITSHKTKHLVKLLRDLLGDRCNSALLVHEGTEDVNNNFRWASSHIASIRRENVEGVSVYNLFKYHEIVMTEAALMKIIHELHEYPKKRGWTLKYATPDGTPAPVPKKVPGWNQSWIDRSIKHAFCTIFLNISFRFNYFLCNN